jgi:branched-chain amino acid transport system substrate-binding protein
MGARPNAKSRTIRTGGVLAVLLTVTALVAGCSSSKSKSGATTSGGSGSGTSPAAAQPTGEPYRIGNLTHQNTSFGQLPKANTATPLAWAKWTNAHGGINGHPVVLTSFDTQSDNAKAVVDAKTLVEQDHVIALAGDNDPTSETAYADYLKAQGIPLIGSAHSQKGYTDANWFPTAASDYAVLSPSVVKAAVAAGVKHFGLIACTESPLCKTDTAAQATAAKTQNLSVATSFSASLAAPSYTAECVKLKQANVDGVYFSATAGAIAKLATDCQRQGMKLKYFFLEPSPNLLKTPAVYATGAYGISVALPYFAEVPANQDFRNAMSQYAPGVDLTSDSATMWSGLEVLKAALEKVPTDAMTPATVIKGLYLLSPGFTDNGLTVPLTYTQGQPFDVNCVILWTLGTNGKYDLTNGTTPSCVTK